MKSDLPETEPLAPLLPVPEAARVLGVSPGRLRNLMLQRRAPRCVRIGRSVRFRPSDLVAWIASHAEESCPSDN